MDQEKNRGQVAPTKGRRIVVVGLGYVGLPLAVALAKKFDCTGFDIDEGRIASLRIGQDITNEVSAAILKTSNLNFTSSAAEIRGAEIYIITVPTPVDGANLPNLSAVRAASRTVGAVLEAGLGQIVVFESTVYPGVTEEICGPELEAMSGLVCGRDFFLGYSPERINPGDREHTVDRITKVIAAQTPTVLEKLAEVYGSITSGGVFRAASIKTAEAAKVIENAQRDINIAFMNEVAIIFSKAGISIHDVLDAASTKWNFLKFTPGLVGGHCIGVDPYYLSYLSQRLGHHPEVILAGRRINDTMSNFVADGIHAALGHPSRLLVLGLTFKEDVPDLRNSKVADLVKRLEWLGHHVTVHDPMADALEAMKEYGIVLEPDALSGCYSGVVAAVPHTEYRNLSAAKITALLETDGLIADLKGIWRDVPTSGLVRRWQL
jgi:UDP-N-acetyl-D-glucosamine/UDP-N-acetyl-D-galactosamine dehydrogenase